MFGHPEDKMCNVRLHTIMIPSHRPRDQPIWYKNDVRTASSLYDQLFSLTSLHSFLLLPSIHLDSTGDWKSLGDRRHRHRGGQQQRRVNRFHSSDSLTQSWWSWQTQIANKSVWSNTNDDQSISGSAEQQPEDQITRVVWDYAKVSLRWLFFSLAFFDGFSIYSRNLLKDSRERWLLKKLFLEGWFKGEGVKG